MRRKASTRQGQPSILCHLRARNPRETVPTLSITWTHLDNPAVPAAVSDDTGCAAEAGAAAAGALLPSSAGATSTSGQETQDAARVAADAAAADPGAVGAPVDDKLAVETACKSANLSL